jgi:hypothetical protein
VHGILGVSVDDVIGGGDHIFQQKCKVLKERFLFGKWKLGSGRYRGKDVVQHDDFSVTVGQKYFCKNVVPVSLTKERRKQVQEPITLEELSEARSVIGNLSYLARGTRLDVAGPAALL